jgi:hypothetical protein
MAYLHHYYESDSKVEQTGLQQRALAYPIINNDLYKTRVSARCFVASTKKKDNKYYQKSMQ